MLDRGDVIYIYDGSFDGLLTAVFYCYYRHEVPINIENGQNVQKKMFCEYFYVTTDIEKAERVSAAICSKISYTAWKNVYLVYLSDAENKEIICLEYIKKGFRIGESIDLYLTLNEVSAVNDTVKRIKNEAHMFVEFIRFGELEGGVYFARIEPKCNVLPLLAKHFSNRFSGVPWIIYDSKRKLCLACNGKCFITEAEHAPNLTYSKNEQSYRHLWKTFYDTIEIKQRHNERCRNSHMPKRFWKNITEMQI